MDLTMPQPGHGSPVSILKGQNDCLACKLAAPGSKSKMTRGMSKNRSRAVMAKIFRLLLTMGLSV